MTRDATLPVRFPRGTGPLAPLRGGRHARPDEQGRVLRHEADLVSLRTSLASWWGPVRLFQSALDQLQGRAAAPVPAAPQAREAAWKLGRALARDPGEAAAVRAFVCEFYELQVALDTEKGRLARQKRQKAPSPIDARSLRSRFHRLAVFLHQLREIPAVDRALAAIDVSALPSLAGRP